MEMLAEEAGANGPATVLGPGGLESPNSFPFPEEGLGGRGEREASEAGLVVVRGCTLSVFNRGVKTSADGGPKPVRKGLQGPHSPSLLRRARLCLGAQRRLFQTEDEAQPPEVSGGRGGGCSLCAPRGVPAPPLGPAAPAPPSGNPGSSDWPTHRDIWVLPSRCAA